MHEGGLWRTYIDNCFICADHSGHFGQEWSIAKRLTLANDDVQKFLMGLDKLYSCQCQISLILPRSSDQPHGILRKWVWHRLDR